jgi:hypothetical protein
MVTYSALLSSVSLHARAAGLPGAGTLFATFAVTTVLVRPLSGRLADTRGQGVVSRFSGSWAAPAFFPRAVSRL